jgi:hypothetical protein
MSGFSAGLKSNSPLLKQGAPTQVEGDLRFGRFFIDVPGFVFCGGKVWAEGLRENREGGQGTKSLRENSRIWEGRGAHRRSLDYARDDKGNGSASIQIR